MSKLPVSKIQLHMPTEEDVAKVLSEGLQKNFTDVSVSVVDCPNLTKEPFFLESEGICGTPRLADVGGPPYLIPLVQRDKIYNFKTIAELVELPHSFMIGAGAGPAHVIGVNSELINNVHLCENGEVKNGAYIAKINEQDGGCVLEQPGSTDFCLMGNFLCCEGKRGRVIEVKASVRTGEENFMSCLRETLGRHYGNKPVGLGGVFLVEKGKANLHIMPDFSKTPLNDSKDVGSWLKFFEMDSPLVCVGELVSHDPPDFSKVPLKTREEADKWLKFFEMDAPLVCVGELVSHDPGYDLRVDHFHCFSKHGQGGHYHYDTTPKDVSYRGYFVLPEYVYRIDQPPVTTALAR